MSNFWRLKTNEAELANILGDDVLTVPAAMREKLRLGHCIVLADWDEQEQMGHTLVFCIVKSVMGGGQVVVDWRKFDVSLRPSSSGRRFWNDRVFFKFAKTVVERYMLKDLFAECFSEYGQAEFGRVIGANKAERSDMNTAYQAQPVKGFVYVIESEYGYKIGKTVNIKSRTQLFSVKLPFPIKLIHYSEFEDYTKAEREFHQHFTAKRLEGEWFDLNGQDIEHIKSLGEPQSLHGL